MDGKITTAGLLNEEMATAAELACTGAHRLLCIFQTPWNVQHKKMSLKLEGRSS